ncbi:MAG: aminopeptidase P family protein [Clostridia bacterium]|nr:aminopeptidase P family protein [Clostridia bacterium]
MKEWYQIRLQKLRNQLSEGEGILVSDPENAFYFTGIHSSNIHLYITQQKAVLLTDFRYREAAESNEAGFSVMTEGSLLSKLKELLTEKTVFIEQQVFTVRLYRMLLEQFPHKEFPDANTMISDIRLIKDKNELKKLKIAQQIADKAYLEMLSFVKEGVSEQELKAELEYRMAKYGAKKPSFDTICLFGSHAALPHGEPGGRTLQKGEVMLFDFGCVYEGYCSDVTRTVFFGDPSETMQAAYETVLTAHKLARDFIGVGKACSDADKVARDYIEHAGYHGAFGHSLGHGVGVKIHEQPTLGQSSTELFQNGMVFSVEPGIYLPGEFGIRIEDTCYLENGDLIATTKLEKELTILG